MIQLDSSFPPALTVMIVKMGSEAGSMGAKGCSCSRAMNQIFGQRVIDANGAIIFCCAALQVIRVESG